MPGEFTIKRRVQFAETDVAGVMHFANYFRWMEEAEHAFWRSLGHCVHMDVGDEVHGWPRVAAHCDYVAPLRFEDEVDIAVRVTRIGERSLTFGFVFEAAGRRVAAGTLTATCCRVANGAFEPIAIAPALRQQLEAHVVDDD